MSKIFSINEGIKEPFIMLVLEDGKMRGKVSTDEALALANEKQLDLVEVSPSHNDQLAICKLLDYGKLKYKQNKHKKKNREVLKEIRLTPNISDHDAETKNKKVIDLLSKKNKVRYVLVLKGPEKRHKMEAEQRMQEWLKLFEGYAKWDEVQFLGNSFSTVLFP